ncbi:MAG: helix-turn-helix transcriptional regulator [Bacteroidales bacterium]|nr:helix-turn-helix transcriptional regulator [Bacteroidales bacterium]
MREEFLQSFGNNVRKIRESKGLTQEALAFMAGLSRSYYTELELGKRNPSLLNIKKLADALCVSLPSLLTF